MARARGVPPERFGARAQHTTRRKLGMFGEPRVNVLELNLALEEAFPKK